jgi:microcystin-dependent protein
VSNTADDRPADDPITTISDTANDLADFQATVLARLARAGGQTGDLEWSMRTSPKPDQLACDGSTVGRDTYAVLWQAVQDNGWVPTFFGAGDGSTTFVLPDFRGRSPVMIGSNGTDTYTMGQKVGAARHTMTVAEIAAHGHSVSATTNSVSHTHADDADHSHSISSDGAHAGHNSGSVGTSASAGSGFSVANTTQNTLGGHAHGNGTGGAGVHHHDAIAHSHTVTVTQSNAGTNSAMDVRPPLIVLNCFVWV